MPTTKVPVGVTTVAGYGGTLLGPIAFVLSQFLPDQDQQTIAELAAAVLTIGSFLVTQAGRYLQARELAKKPASPVVQIPSVQTTSGTSGVVQWTQVPPQSQPQVEAPNDVDLDPEPPEGPNPAAAREVLDRTGR